GVVEERGVQVGGQAAVGEVPGGEPGDRDAVAAGGNVRAAEERLTGDGPVDGAEEVVVPAGHRGGRAPVAGAGHEVVGAVHRVHHPATVVPPRDERALLAEDAVLGPVVRQEVRDAAFGGGVGLRDHVGDGGLAADVQSALAQAPGQRPGVDDE